jgi:hypothetical protein
MGIDLEAIRRRVQELSGQKKSSNIQLWKPTPGQEYKIRALPYSGLQEGNPILERYSYYIGDNRGFFSPKQFGKPDPIDTLISSLFRSGKPEDKVIAKKLMPKLRAYVPIIVRGEESKGVQIWSISKFLYQRLLSFFIDEEVGDILNPVDGYDLKVTITQIPGKQYPDTVVDAARKPSKLSDDPTQVKAWLAAVPNVDDMYPPKSEAEIEKLLNDWLNGGASSESEGTSRGPVEKVK